MSAKKKRTDDVYADLYDDSLPCEKDESVILIKDDDKIACERMQAANLAVNLQGTSGPGAKKSRVKAEADLHAAILDAVDAARKKAGIRCDSKNTKCDKGLCYTTYEIDERRVRCRLAKRKAATIWLCTYNGNVRHSCICVT